MNRIIRAEIFILLLVSNCFTKVIKFNIEKNKEGHYVVALNKGSSTGSVSNSDRLMQKINGERKLSLTKTEVRQVKSLNPEQRKLFIKKIFEQFGVFFKAIWNTFVGFFRYLFYFLGKQFLLPVIKGFMVGGITGGIYGASKSIPIKHKKDSYERWLSISKTRVAQEKALADETFQIKLKLKKVNNLIKTMTSVSQFQLQSKLNQLQNVLEINVE